MEDGWIEWAGGECPVAPKTRVEVRFSDDDIDDGPACFWSQGAFDWWKHESRNPNCNIIAYRIIPQ